MTKIINKSTNTLCLLNFVLRLSNNHLNPKIIQVSSSDTGSSEDDDSGSDSEQVDVGAIVGQSVIVRQNML